VRALETERWRAEADISPDNHIPEDSSADSLHLQPSSASDTTNYDLSFSDNNNEEYSYNGVRTSGDGQYVLIFDPTKKHFVLHRIDSTFDMNLISAPWSDDASELRSQYPQLQPLTPPKPSPSTQRKAPATAKKAAAPKAPKAPPKRAPKAEKQTKKSKPAPREPTPEPEEDSDDGLTIEYPDAPNSNQQYNRAVSTFQREQSEEVISDEDEDAEGEEYEEERNQDVDLLKLPSPVGAGISDEDMDMEADLEAELEQALQEADAENGNASSESEEEWFLRDNLWDFGNMDGVWMYGWVLEWE